MYNQNKIFRTLKLISLLNSQTPKSVNVLSETLNISERSVYRYFSMLEALGFNLVKDSSSNYFIPEYEPFNTFSFSIEEAEFLNDLLNRYANGSELTERIKNKVYFSSNIGTPSKLLNVSNAQRKIKKIRKAILNRKIGILEIDLFGENKQSQTKKVEFIAFSENYQKIKVFDVELKMVDDFFLESIFEVKISDDLVFNEKAYKSFEKDCFFCVENTTKRYYKVHLELSFSAYSKLKSDYPETENYLVPKKRNQSIYTFKCHVYCLKPVLRFINLMKSDVQVIGELGVVHSS